MIPFRARSFVFAAAIVTHCLFSAPVIVAHVGTGIDVDRQGRIFFTDTYHNRIWRLDTNGTLTAMASGLHCDYLIVGDDDSLYVITDSVWRITPQGQMTEFLGAAQFPKDARPFCIDRQGNIYFEKRASEIYKRSPDGKVSLIAGSESGQQDGRGTAASFSHINSAAFGPDRSLYVRDWQQICKITSDGTVSTLPHSEEAGMAEDGEESFRRTMGIAVDAEGQVYVANYWKRQILKLRPDGEVVGLMNSRWPWVPVAVAVSGHDVYVLERMGNPYGPSAFLEVSTLADRLGSPRVRKIASDGTIITLVVVKPERGWAIIIVPLVFVALALVAWRIRRRQKRQE